MVHFTITCDVVHGMFDLNGQKCIKNQEKDDIMMMRTRCELRKPCFLHLAVATVTLLRRKIWNIAFGARSSDLYRPQFWDDKFKFSFSVNFSCKSNTQLGYFLWKNGTSSLKTLFTHFVLTFVNLMSRHDTCDFSRFTW